MKWETWLTAGIVCLGLGLNISGCGSPNRPGIEVRPGESEGEFEPPRAEAQLPEPMPEASPYHRVQLEGSASFGSHCSFGLFAAPQPVPLELLGCPLIVQKLELAESLPPFIFQADCKKRTLDIRGREGEGYQATNWEFMPDGTFQVVIDGGTAQVRDDGAGNLNCFTPLVASLWGNVDCTDIDRAVVHVETVWWVGKEYERSEYPSPRASRAPSPSATSSPQPSPSSHSPPSPMTSATPLPAPTPTSITPTASPTPPLTSSPSLRLRPNAGAQCQIPSGCYFHNISHLDLCPK